MTTVRICTADQHFILDEIWRTMLLQSEEKFFPTISEIYYSHKSRTEIKKSKSSDFPDMEKASDSWEFSWCAREECGSGISLMQFKRLFSNIPSVLYYLVYVPKTHLLRLDFRKCQEGKKTLEFWKMNVCCSIVVCWCWKSSKTKATWHHSA